MNIPDVSNEVKELIRVIKRTTSVSENEAERLTRLLRPQYEAISYGPAIKHRLKEQIISHANQSNSNGAIELAEFDRLLEVLRNLDPKIVAPILSFFEPLSFQKHLDRKNINYFNVSSEKISSRKDMEEAKSREDENYKRFIPVGHLKTLPEKDNTVLRSDLLWISPETEIKLLKDLLYIFQVIYIYILSTHKNIHSLLNISKNFLSIM